MRAGVRLRPGRGRRGRSPTARATGGRGRRQRPGVPAQHRHADRHRGRHGSRPPRAVEGRHGVLRAVLGRGARRRPPTPPRRTAHIDGDVLFWRNWLARARIPDHALRHPLERSALTIKGLTYMPTGATVAALTTSLPETPGGERNWDYRYTWMRDTTFTLQALHYLNLDWEADEFMQFVADLEPNPDGGLQIMYGIDGRRDLTESTREELSGYEGAQPGPPRQRRLRPAAERRVRRRARLDAAAHPAQPAPAPAAVAARAVAGGRRDRRLARARTRASGRHAAKPQHYVSSKLMGWVALDRAAKLAAIRDDAKLENEWAGDRRGDQGGHPRARRRATAGSCVSTTTPTRWTPRPCWPPLRVPAGHRRADSQHRHGDRRGAHRERVRPALPHRRDRRRAVREGGDLPDLLVLAGLRLGGDRRHGEGNEPDGAAAADRVTAGPVRRGVRGGAARGTSATSRRPSPTWP